MTIIEVAEKWGISKRRIQLLCMEGRIDGAIKRTRSWFPPSNTESPIEARIGRKSEMKIDRQG